MGMLLYLAVNFALLHRACLDILLQWVIKYFNTASVFLQATPNSWSDQEAQSAYHPSKPCRNPSIQMQKKNAEKKYRLNWELTQKALLFAAFSVLHCHYWDYSYYTILMIYTQPTYEKKKKTILKSLLHHFHTHLKNSWFWCTPFNDLIRFEKWWKKYYYY